MQTPSPWQRSLSVTFSSHHEGVRLPDPKLLALHAVCARVVNMSGPAKTFDEFQSYAEDRRILAYDGSSTRLLDHLVTPFHSGHRG